MVIDLARHAQAIGADYIVVHAPVLHFLREQDQTLHGYYRRISEQLDIGIALWSHPDSGYLMSPELCARIAEIPNVVAIKYSVPREMYARLTQLAGDRILVSTASEEEWLDNIVELGWQLYLCSSPPFLVQTGATAACANTPILRCAEVERAHGVRDSLDPVRDAIRRTRPAENPRPIRNSGRSCSGNTAARCAVPCSSSAPPRKTPPARLRGLRARARGPRAALVGGLNDNDGGSHMANGRLHAFNFQDWINQHQHLLKPPVGNKKVFEAGDMTVQVVGGPNERTDYHDDPVEEFFYQLKGDMVLKVVDNGKFYDVPIRRGRCVPAAGACAPLAAAPAGRLDRAGGGSGRPDAVNAFEWYCSNAGRSFTASRPRSAPRPGPAAALRGVLPRRGGAQMQAMRGIHPARGRRRDG